MTQPLHHDSSREEEEEFSKLLPANKADHLDHTLVHVKELNNHT